jgi:Leucine-rich repeat (LRR) protein
MDIIYQLPFPTEICSKIFIFACKSPYTGLGVAMLKNRLNVKNLIIPEKDEDVNIIALYKITNYPENIYIDLYFYTCFKNLTVINLGTTGVTGDIIHLKSLPNLKKIYFTHTEIYGDIVHLKSLPNLTEILLAETEIFGDIAELKSLTKLTEVDLSYTMVTGDIVSLNSLTNLTTIDLSFNNEIYGDIAELKSLANLTAINLHETGVIGNFVHLKSLKKLSMIEFEDTGVTGDENAFHEYRESTMLNNCHLYL